MNIIDKRRQAVAKIEDALQYEPLTAEMREAHIQKLRELNAAIAAELLRTDPRFNDLATVIRAAAPHQCICCRD